MFLPDPILEVLTVFGLLEEEKASIQRALGASNVGYLVKPFHIQEAMALVSAPHFWGCFLWSIHDRRENMNKQKRKQGKYMACPQHYDAVYQTVQAFLANLENLSNYV